MLGKIIKMLTGLVLFVVVVAVGFLFYQAVQSREGDAPGLDNGRLAACPATPNCICSEDPNDRDHFLPPLAYTAADQIDVRSYIPGIVEETGGTVTADSGDYISAEFRSSIMGFVDDVEFRVDDSSGLVHVRSASRVGKSDLGANSKRYHALKQRFAAALEDTSSRN